MTVSNGDTDASPTPSPPRRQRTYGRARNAAPIDEDADGTASVSIVFGAPTAEASPSKSLLNRFSKTAKDWRQSLATLDTDDEPPETENDVMAAMASLRKELAPASNNAQDGSRNRSLQPTTSLSSLTELPSSPPPRQADSDVPSASQRPSLASRTVNIGTSSLTLAPPTSSPDKVSHESPRHSSVTPPAPSPLPIDNEPLSTVKAGPRPRTKRVVTSDDDGSSDDLDVEDAPRQQSSPTKAPAAADPLQALGGQLHLFSDDEDEGLGERSLASRSSMKPLKKADQEQLRRDVSKAKRERPVTLSRTQTERRPVSEWLQRADGAVRTQALPPAASTPEDIQQFPPSSLPAQRSSDPAGPGRTVNFQKPTSSPTPLARRPTGIPATSAASDSDSEPEDILQALEKAERKSERKKNLDGIKRKAMEAKALRRAEPNGSDDELSVLPVTTTSKVGTKASTPQSIISGRIAAAAPNKQKQNLMRISGARVGAGRRVVTETHLQFAGKDFDHANQKMANAGSRPAGQKQGRDNIISQLQMQAQMQANHKKQVLDLKTAKERQFGKGRQLPAKQAIDLAAMTNGLAQHGSDQDDMASDEGDSDYDPEPHSGDEGDLIIGDDVDDAASNGSVVGDSVVQPTSREETPQADTNPGRNRQVAFVDPEDDEPDLVTQPRRHPSRRARRVAADSESETEDAEPPAPQTATEIGTAASNVTVGFGDFGDGFGADGFSQLFETTQAAVGSENDGLAGLRNDNGGLLPEHAALPGVQMSESQARRDNALVAGELENPASQAVQQQQAGNQYLNSQGFFTQSRPRQDDTQPTASRSGTEVDPSSTLILSTSNVGQSSPASNALSPTQGSHHLRRLRRRHSEADEEVAESQAQPAARRDAFQALADGARRALVHETTRSKPRDAAFVDEQAEESDEDNAWGFGKADDDEDDGMDEGYIPDLLDDAVVDAEEREKQKALADAKLREIAQEDDARREAEAKKITDGHYRHKRRGNDFLSDEEDDESRSRRLTKKQRRQRKLEREDGLYKLDGESNAFLKEYERDLESDNEFEESVEEPAALHSPSRDALSSREVHELIRLNREEIEIEHHSDEESESLVTIARRTRVTTLATTDAEVDTLVTSRVSKQTTRSTESYMMFLKDQSSNAGRGGSGRGGVSVVQKANPGAGHAPLHRSKTSSTHDLGQRTGRVLIDKTTRFN